MSDLYQILHGDCLEVLRRLQERSVQTCVTSPPYFGLRDYGLPPTDWPEMEYSPMPGMPPVTVPAITCCFGLESDPVSFIGHMVLIFREVHRVLRDDGTLWLNLGDSYAGGGGGNYSKSAKQTAHGEHITNVRNRSDWLGATSLKPKDLIGIPWRVAFALQADGWYLRQDIIWHKPNPMPESVRDRCTKAHEYIFLLSKSERYFFDSEAVKEESKTSWSSEQGFSEKGQAARSVGIDGHRNGAGAHSEELKTGRNRRSVWSIATRPYWGALFATFPPALIEPCILAGTSAHGNCIECGKPWERITEKVTDFMGNSAKAGRTADELNANGKWRNGGEAGNKNLKLGPTTTTTTTGWRPTCACGAETAPAVVLDVFNGSGTTGAVAVQHGRQYIGIELNPEYIELAHDRIKAASAPAKPPRQKRPKPAPKAQADMFAAEMAT